VKSKTAFAHGITIFLGLCMIGGCAPQKSRDMAGARVEMNPPKTEQFVTKVDAIRPGTPMQTVREQLGAPDEFRQGSVNARPEPGPTEALTTLAPAGTRYEHWIYKRGDSHYHVFFTRGARGGDVEWEVLAVRSSRKDEVY
jgi:hypothetical protein